MLFTNVPDNRRKDASGRLSRVFAVRGFLGSNTVTRGKQGVWSRTTHPSHHELTTRLGLHQLLGGSGTDDYQHSITPMTKHQETDAIHSTI